MNFCPPTCTNYHNGAGTAACLKCRRYRLFQMSSARRHNVKIDLATNDIIEQIADERGPDGEDILARIQSLPPDLSAVLSLRCLSGLTEAEISRTLRISPRTVSRRVKVALKILRRR